MPRTSIRGSQIIDGTVQRVDLDTDTSSQSVIRKVIAGSGIAISFTGVDSGTGDVTITSTSTSTSLSVVTKTANYTITNTDDVVLVDCTAGNITITLPNVATATIKRFTIKKIDASVNKITVQGDANIDTNATYPILFKNTSIDLITNNVLWKIH